MRKLSFALLALGAALVASTAHAESLIWNVPSTDIMESRKVYLELDALQGVKSYDDGGYTVGGLRTIYGVNDRLEVGANLFGTRSSVPNPLELTFNAKYKLYDGGANGFAVAAGTSLTVPVANANYGGDTFGTLYVVGSKKFDGDWGPRFSLGGWQLVGRDAGTGSTTGFMAGYEQPLTSKLSFMLDYQSGNQVHGGYSSLTGGFLYALSDKVTLAVSYSAPNVDRSNAAVFGFVGVKF